jgi:hypothetical protein
MPTKEEALPEGYEAIYSSAWQDGDLYWDTQLAQWAPFRVGRQGSKIENSIYYAARPRSRNYDNPITQGEDQW